PGRGGCGGTVRWRTVGRVVAKRVVRRVVAGRGSGRVALERAIGRRRVDPHRRRRRQALRAHTYAHLRRSHVGEPEPGGVERDAAHDLRVVHEDVEAVGSDGPEPAYRTPRSLDENAPGE